MGSVIHPVHDMFDPVHAQVEDIVHNMFYLNVLLMTGLGITDLVLNHSKIHWARASLQLTNTLNVFYLLTPFSIDPGMPLAAPIAEVSSGLLFRGVLKTTI